jgi:FkbH-like protein
MAGFQDPTLQKWLDQVRREPTFTVYQQVGSHLTNFVDLQKLAGVRKVKVAILSSFTVAPIQPYLQISALERDVYLKIFISGFNQFAQEIMDPQSQLYTFLPDVCFLHLPLQALCPDLKGLGMDKSQTGLLLNRIQDFLRAFRQNTKADLVMSNFAVPFRFPYMLSQLSELETTRKVNEALLERTNNFPGIYVLDFERLTANFGKERLTDERFKYLASMELSDLFFSKLADQLLAHIFALRGLNRKCIVLDLDNILWGGEVGEVGPDRIHLGPEYPGSAFVEFQKSLLELHSRGILLALNSKNNESFALEVIRSHPSMLLRPEHFASIKINWDNKHKNIELIAKELNLGPESFVFIDDNPAERELMRCLQPAVFTPDWPPDPVLYRKALESLWDFESIQVTDEDLQRNKMYELQRHNEALRLSKRTLEDYLFSLEMKIEVGEAQEKDLPRIHQLIQKTNQFNLTTKRYTIAEVEAFHCNKNAMLAVLKTEDRFGQNGLVGVALVIKEPILLEETWRIDSLLISCRVLGRTIETGFLKQLILEFEKRGAKKLIGEYITTSKNKPAQDFYLRMGFKEDLTRSTKEKLYWQGILDLEHCQLPDLPWLDIKNCFALSKVS